MLFAQQPTPPVNASRKVVAQPATWSMTTTRTPIPQQASLPVPATWVMKTILAARGRAAECQSRLPAFPHILSAIDPPGTDI